MSEQPGPVLPSKALVQLKAREIGVLAARAMEFAGSGPTADLQLALKQLDGMRAILGPAAGTPSDNRGAD